MLLHPIYLMYHLNSAFPAHAIAMRAELDFLLPNSVFIFFKKENMFPRMKFKLTSDIQPLESPLQFQLENSVQNQNLEFRKAIKTG